MKNKSVKKLLKLKTDYKNPYVSKSKLVIPTTVELRVPKKYRPVKYKKKK